MRYARSSWLAAMALALLGGVGSGCEPLPPALPSASPDPQLLVGTTFVQMSGGNWSHDAWVQVAIRAVSYGRKATELSMERAALYAPGDRGSPLAMLGVALDRTSVPFAASDTEELMLVNDGTINRDLAAACGMVDLVVTLRSSSCGCDITASAPAAVVCFADNGADAELALVGEPAPAGRPCGMRSYSTSGGVEELDREERYRYDTIGRLLFADALDASGTWVERMVYSYQTGSLLAGRASIGPAAESFRSRWTYAYAGGTLASIQRDGSLSLPPDGVADEAWTYALAGDVWTERTGYDTTTYTYDPTALTISTSSGDTFWLVERLDDPSLFFATTRVDAPSVAHSEHVQGGLTMTVTYTYDGARLLEVRSSELFGTSFRDELLYSCP